MSVSTDMVPKKDRLEWWTHMSGHEVVSTSVSTEHVGDFYGRAQFVDLSGTRLVEFTVSPVTARRTPAHIRRHDPDSYQLFLVRGDPIRIEQRRDDSYLEAGDMALIDTSYPFVAEFLDFDRLAELTFMSMPREVLPLPRGQVERLLAHKLPARTGSGAVLARYLTSLHQQAADCDQAELSRLGTIGIDLAAAFLAGRIDAGRHLPAESRQQALTARINAFIDHHLGDPDLGPAGIAARHHISSRTLHVLFERQPETVAATIRRRRLERCLADLADPRLRDRPIGEIGLSWGFRSAAEFSRAFRAAYGVSPMAHRRRALAEAGDREDRAREPAAGTPRRRR